MCPWTKAARRISTTRKANVFRWLGETTQKMIYPQCIVLPTVDESELLCEEGVPHLCSHFFACAVMGGRSKGRRRSSSTFSSQDKAGAHGDRRHGGRVRGPQPGHLYAKPR